MTLEKNLFFKKEFVEKYDDAIKQQKWYGAEILFGMVYEYLKKNDKILDIGIGTGLSATAFCKAGLEIYGLDNSLEMLEACKQKKIAANLQQFDLNNTPLPYQTNYFNHVSANAVLYFIPKLDDLFAEISRILEITGIWAFIVEENTNQQQLKFIEKPIGKNKLVNYQHNINYLFDLMKSKRFSLLKKVAFVADNFQMEGKAVPFQLYVTQKDNKAFGAERKKRAPAEKQR